MAAWMSPRGGASCSAGGAGVGVGVDFFERWAQVPVRLAHDGIGDLDGVEELGAFRGTDDPEEHAEGDAGDEVVKIFFSRERRHGEPEGYAGPFFGEGGGTALQDRVAIGELPRLDTAGDGGIVVGRHVQPGEFVRHLFTDFLSNHGLFSLSGPVWFFRNKYGRSEEMNLQKFCGAMWLMGQRF